MAKKDNGGLERQLQFIIYSTPEQDVKVKAAIKDETLWLTQRAMAELFDVNIPAISKHLKNIYDDEELSEFATVSKMEIVQKEGNRDISRQVDFYNLDAIIAVGYRVNSKRATAFTMAQFIESVNEFILFRKFKLLTHKGHITRAKADAKAKSEYDIFNRTQLIVSDFDRMIKRLTTKAKPTKKDRGDGGNE